MVVPGTPLAVTNYLSQSSTSSFPFESHYRKKRFDLLTINYTLYAAGFMVSARGLQLDCCGEVKDVLEALLADGHASPLLQFFI